MRFDWSAFCMRHRVQFVTSGPNTAKGNISIRCPFCGAADHSHHMGLSLNINDPAWGCFRNPLHRGRNPVRLISKLLGITWQQAESIANEQGGAVIDDFEDAVNKLRPKTAVTLSQTTSGSVHIPKQFRPINAATGGYSIRFIEYLYTRKFDWEDVQLLINQYLIWYCLLGDYAWRIIFPVYSSPGVIVGWTARDITGTSDIRYMTKEGMGKDVLFNFFEHVGSDKGDHLVICEGPLDALKIDYYGRQFGIRAVATMGTSYTDGQLSLICKLSSKFKTVSVMFDADAWDKGMKLVDDISSHVVAKQLFLPFPYKDPGELPPLEVKRILSSLRSG